MLAYAFGSRAGTTDIRTQPSLVAASPIPYREDEDREGIIDTIPSLWRIARAFSCAFGP